MNLLIAGKILGTHHLKGEVTVLSNIENIELLQGNKIMLELENSQTKLFTVKKITPFIANKWIFSFEEIKNKQDAVEIRNALIKVRRDLVGLSEDEHLMSELIGIKVYDIKGNEFLGEVTEIFETAAHDIYVINTEEYEIMIPDVEVFVKKVDYEQRVMTVDLIEGMKEIKNKK